MPLEIPGARHLHSGKVRDLYEVQDGHLLMVASDRISAYDFLLTPGIPDKGEILTRMSLWWFDQLSDIVPNHVVSTAVPERVRGRALIVEKLDMFPVECVARGYLTGSGLIDYNATGEVCGVPLPAGLVDASRLPAPIFTPATKAEMGEHVADRPIADIDRGRVLVAAAFERHAIAAGEAHELRRAEAFRHGEPWQVQALARRDQPVT